MLWGLGRYLLPILGLLCLAGVAVNILQIGFLFLPQRLAFDLGRSIRWADCGEFSRRQHGPPGIGVFKLIVVSAVSCAVLYSQREALLGLSALAPPALAGQMAQVLLGTGLRVGAALLVLAISTTPTSDGGTSKT